MILPEAAVHEKARPCGQRSVAPIFSSQPALNSCWGGMLPSMQMMTGRPSLRSARRRDENCLRYAFPAEAEKSFEDWRVGGLEG